jgi:hypothetical protein
VVVDGLDLIAEAVKRLTVGWPNWIRSWFGPGVRTVCGACPLSTGDSFLPRALSHLDSGIPDNASHFQSMQKTGMLNLSPGYDGRA